MPLKKHRRTPHKKTSAAKPSGDLYQEVTDKIIKEMEAGSLPWVRPWDAAHPSCAVGLPRNIISQNAYSGINILLLWSAVIDHGYSSQNWLTFKQAQDLGGTVRKGEHGEVICFADRFTPAKERADAQEQGREAQAIPFLKRYRVFNVAQCDGLPEDFLTSPAPQPATQLLPQAAKIVAATKADIRIGGSRAFYHPEHDVVQLPPQQAFTQPINYYRTLFHELGHWSGHKSRLGRDLSGRFQTQSYAREELVAELSAAFTCASLSIEPTVRHADYLASWLTLLKEDKRAIFKAASQASKATTFILNGATEPQRTTSPLQTSDKKKRYFEEIAVD